MMIVSPFGACFRDRLVVRKGDEEEKPTEEEEDLDDQVRHMHGTELSRQLCVGERSWVVAGGASGMREDGPARARAMLAVCCAAAGPVVVVGASSCQGSGSCVLWCTRRQQSVAQPLVTAKLGVFHRSLPLSLLVRSALGPSPPSVHTPISCARI